MIRKRWLGQGRWITLFVHGFGFGVGGIVVVCWVVEGLAQTGGSVVEVCHGCWSMCAFVNVVSACDGARVS